MHPVIQRKVDELRANATNPYKLGWDKKPSSALEKWKLSGSTSLLLSGKREPMRVDEILAELNRIQALPEGDTTVIAMRDLFYGREGFGRAITLALLDAYDAQAAGHMRDVLFGSLLFSSEPDFVSDQLLARAIGQIADERQYAFLATLPTRHAEVWSMFCESVTGCQTEEGAGKAGMAISLMVGAYGIESGHLTFARKMRALSQSARFPEARGYLYQAMVQAASLAYMADDVKAQILDEVRSALESEPDEKVRKDTRRSHPALRE